MFNFFKSKRNRLKEQATAAFVISSLQYRGWHLKKLRSFLIWRLT